ncbi:hypothetical protein PR001_g32174 [Phytophthora rubi]|uniref:Uncharacterized protein n=1 Tax=Phytophthora rubi TaxID=129364 RepID=A0A6A3GN84_9STRA|nr:hypothetical protein PR001_g32174 [Phytophthora rubi]
MIVAHTLELSNQRSLVQARVAQPRSRGLLPRQRRAARAAVPEPDSADARLAAGLQHRAFGHLLAADQVGERLDERLNQRRHAVQMRAVRIRGVTVRVVTDYGGSCNGAKIRFSPQKDWPVNASVAKTISALDPVKESHPTLSTAHDVDDDVAHCACSTRAVPESPHCRHPCGHPRKSVPASSRVIWPVSTIMWAPLRTRRWFWRAVRAV